MSAGLLSLKAAVRELQLSNEKGRRLSVLLREYEAGEEEKLIACIRDEYGDTYFRRDLYRPERIRQAARSGHALFLVAEVLAGDEGLPGEIAGMLTLKQSDPEDNICEMASMIFRKKYRGYGLAMPFLRYGADIARTGRFSAIYGLSALSHDMTQKLLYRQEMRAAGFLFNILDMGRIDHSYRKDRNPKHPGGIQVMALEKRNAGVLYLPPEHEGFCRLIYDRLGVKYRIRRASRRGMQRAGIEKRQTVSDIVRVEDKLQSSTEIHIRRIGADLEERLREIHESHPLTGRQTINAFLNINDVSAVQAYELLKKAGYFFAGLRPLCGKREYIVLHNPGVVKIFMEDLTVTEEFALLLLYVDEARKKDCKINC